MKTNIIPALMGTVSFFTGISSAFNGQLRLDTVCSEGCNTVLNLRDYDTGSTYTCGVLVPSFCSYEGRCPVICRETSPGGYNFNAQFWQTSDGCDNIDFEGALDSHHEYCCGGAPCDIS
ncbi:hypothetical protein QBC37DRAFT_425212 [Rhypophila decipiens]|uniref:Uncharacterized protein n=1 Tax=Rhypophila decipiens TaxID=261697 RepID=A0AAN6Y431_9PEZI|nr:hypothetical protein QBC37DRAFT_425212 [Rhypophila decipiens]